MLSLVLVVAIGFAGCDVVPAEPAAERTATELEEPDAGELEAAAEVEKEAALPEPDDGTEPPEPDTNVEDPPADATTYQIWGRVYRDTNWDSLFHTGDGDEPVRGAKVTLMDEGTGEEIDFLWTDASGFYTFTVPQREGTVFVIVAPPEGDEDLVFSVPTEGLPELAPSSVDEDGFSVAAFAFDRPQFTVNAGLTDLFEPPADLFVVDLATGQPVDNPFLSGFTYDLTADESDIILEFDLSALPADEPFFVGLDLIGDGLLVTDPVEGFGMTGANTGASVAFLNGELQGTNAVAVSQDGETVPTSTGLRFQPLGNRGALFFPAAELRSGLDSFRLVFSDGNTGLVSGDPTVNGGYTLAADANQLFGDLLAARDTVPFLERVNQTLIQVPVSLGHERTGDQTFQFTLDGTLFSTQIDVSPAMAQDRADQFGDVYELQAGSEIATALRTWMAYPLHYQDEPFGVLAVTDNDSAANPAAIALSAISSTAINVDQLAALEDVIGSMVPSVQSIYFNAE